MVKIVRNPQLLMNYYSWSSGVPRVGSYIFLEYIRLSFEFHDCAFSDDVVSRSENSDWNTNLVW